MTGCTSSSDLSEVDLTDDISSLFSALPRMFLPAVLGRMLACIGLACVPTLGSTVDEVLFVSLFGGDPLSPLSFPGGGSLPPSGGPLLSLLP